MKAIHSMIAALGLALVLSAPADAALNDPEVIIYRFPGVRDDGSAANVGVATVFHCTNFSGVTESVRFVTRTPLGALVINANFAINHLQTMTTSTHSTAAYGGGSLSPGTALTSGTMAIAATSMNIVCTAMTIDASAAVPTGVALHGIRFSPVPGSQE